MSITVAAAPILLIQSLATIIAIANSGMSALVSENDNFHINKDVAEKIFNQEFQTQIVDKNTLLKTLKEHGATNIQEAYGNISCTCEQFQIEFIYNGEQPYTMKVSARDEFGIDDLISDIGNEYTANCQEISYNKIKERLAKQNLTIAEEEIYEDNTIVLTVNLD